MDQRIQTQDAALRSSRAMLDADPSSVVSFDRCERACKGLVVETMGPS